MNANIMVSTSGDTIVVDVSMEFVGEYGTCQRLTTADIENVLRDRKVKFGKVISSCSLCNDNEASLLGQWVFEKMTPPISKSAPDGVSSPPKRPRKKKTPVTPND